MAPVTATSRNIRTSLLPVDPAVTFPMVDIPSASQPQAQRVQARATRGVVVEARQRFAAGGAPAHVRAALERSVGTRTAQSSAVHANSAHATGQLRMGARGQEVAQMQQMLADLGYNVGPVDGKFGPMTDAAVRAFQRDHGLKADGWCGPKTQAALQEAHAGAPAQGSPTPDAPPTDAPPTAAPGPVDGAPGTPVRDVGGMLDWARSMVGTPYAAVNPFRFGDVLWDGKAHKSENGSGTVWQYPKGTRVFDCSGFVVASYRQLGVDLAAHGMTTSGSIHENKQGFLKDITPDQLQPGDLIVYKPSSSGVGHVVIYMGDGKCIDATGQGVGIHDVDWNRIRSCRRVPLPGEA